MLNQLGSCEVQAGGCQVKHLTTRRHESGRQVFHLTT